MRPAQAADEATTTEAGLITAAACYTPRESCGRPHERRRQLSALESLAAWKGVPVADLAQQLLVMAPDEVTRLQQGYAATHREIMATALRVPAGA